MSDAPPTRPDASTITNDERLRALHRYDVLDTPPEPAFDRVAELAADLLGMPTALISLVDADRQWAKSCIGWDDRESGLDVSFCAHAIQSDDVLVVEDAIQDERFAAFSVVAEEPGVRFYAGAPLLTPDGYALGTLCVMDTEPRTLSATETEHLRRLAAIVVDELEMRREARQMAWAENTIERIVENAQPIVFMVDDSGTFILSEGQDLDVLDLAPGEAVGRSMYDMFSDHPRAIDLVERALDGETVDATVTIDDATFDVWCAPYRNDAGRVAGCLGMATDVTELKQTRSSLLREREFLRKLFDTIPVMIVIYEPVDEEVAVNREFERVLGWSADDAKTPAIIEACRSGQPPSDVDDDVRASPRTDTSSIEWHDLVLPAEDDTEVPVSWTVLELSDDTLVGVGMDLTERKKMETKLREAQKMETVGTLTAGIAHDFNNFLHAASVYVQLVRDDLPAGSSEHEYLTRAEKGLSRAEGLVDKLLTFSRSDPPDDEHEAVDVAQAVSEALDLVGPSIPKGVAIESKLQTGLRIQGDSGQIQQVAMNLMANAAHALQENEDGRRSLTVEVQPVQMDEHVARRYLNLEPGSYVCLRVADTGPGMDAQTRERIFDPFFTTKDKGEGTGLGLAVVYGIVQSHGGEITVYTEPGEGTTFVVYLPAEEQREDPESDAQGTSRTDLSGRHVLFVDDNEQIRDMEQIRLAQMGLHVTTCTCGASAVDVVKGNPAEIDVVLTDFSMPGMNGIEFAETIKDHGYDGPVILMSGFTTQIEEHVTRTHVDAVLRKPVSTHQIRHTFTHLL